MQCNKRFTNRVTRSALEIRSPHFYARPSQARAVQKGSGFVFPSTDRVTGRLVIRYYLLTRLLSLLIHENTKSNLFVQSDLAGAIHNSDCFIFPRMDQ